MIAVKKSVVLAVVVCLVAGTGYYLYQKQAAASPELRYKTQALAKATSTQTVSANGTLNPVTLVSVGTQVSGTVKKLHVDSRPGQGRAGAGRVDDAIYSAQCGKATPASPAHRPACSWRAPARRA